MYYFSLYIEFIKIRLKAMVEYRAETIWTGIAEAAGYLAEFAILWVMINKFETIGGWSPYEVMLLYAFNLFTYASAGSFLYRTCNNLPERVRTGSFDEVITRPTNPFLYLTCSGFLYGYISHITVSIIIITICFLNLSITLTLTKIVFLIISLIGGTLIQGSIFLFSAVPSFWMVKNDALRNLLWSGRSFTKYPISAYSKSVQVILTLILPFAFINFYPAQCFLGKNDFLMFHPIFQYLTPIVGIGLFGLAYMFWLYGIQNYTSTGS